MAAQGNYDRHMTYAELCQAIEEGRVRSTVRDDHYEVRADDVRRLRRLNRPRLALPALPALADIPVELLECPSESQLHYSA